MTAVGITIIFALFAVFEISALKKGGRKKELAVYCILMSAAYVLGMLLVFDVQIPSINHMIGDLIMPLTGE